MDYAYRLISNVKYFYNTMNPATLTGAIDVIVVEQPDGTFQSTPFHVRFGKYGVFNSDDKYADISINGEEIELKMKLGDNGVAFFVEETDMDDLPDHLVSSPFPDSTPNTSLDYEIFKRSTKQESRSRYEQQRTRQMLSESSSISRSPSPLIARRQTLDTKATKQMQAKHKKSLPFSSSVFSSRRYRSLPDLSSFDEEREDVEYGGWHISNRANAKELDHNRNSKVLRQSHSTILKRSHSPVPSVSRKKKSVSICVDESPSKKPVFQIENDSDTDESSISSSPDASMIQMPEKLNDVKLADIAEGALSDSEVDRQRNAPLPRGSDVTDWKWGEIPETRDNSKEQKTEPVNEAKPSTWNWWPRWGRNAPATNTKPVEDQGIYLDDLVENKADPEKIGKYIGKVTNTSCSSPPIDSGACSTSSAGPSSVCSDQDGTIKEDQPKSRRSSQEDKTPTQEKVATAVIKGEVVEKQLLVGADDPSTSPPPLMTAASADGLNRKTRQKTMSGATSGVRSVSPNSDIFPLSDDEEHAPHGKRYIRTLRLSSDKLKSLRLHRGANEARFSITTRIQGTSWCSCHIYLYKWSDRMVISDIDGTITKSDVLGHVIPAIGGTWAHAGVAELYTRIKDNGYKLVYLSSRAIGQSYYTKKYLQSIAQNSKLLPDGPVLLSPTSVLMAFRREVIERRPEEFKIAALADLKALFPVKQPFYAGFGNRETDVVSYRAVNVPPERILVIDPSGRVRRSDSIGYVSTYYSMATDIVDYMFPPLMKQKVKEDEDSLKSIKLKPTFTKAAQYSAFTHWRSKQDQAAMIDDDDIVQYETQRKKSIQEQRKKRK